MGRSRTECPEMESLRSPLKMKRSTGDISCPPSPTRRNLVDVIGLSNYQQKLIVQYWPNIYTTGASGPFATSIYSTLSAKNLKAKELLAKADGVAVFSRSDLNSSNMHCRVTVEVLDLIIKGLDNDAAEMTAYLTDVGKHHRYLRSEGLSTVVWDDLGDAIMDCARKRCEAVRKHKQLRRAWLAIIAYMMDNIKQGHSVQRANSSYDVNSPSKTAVSKNNSCI